VGIVQTTALLTGVLQLPEAAVALTNVTPLETEPLTKIPFARSGPWLVTVKVIVTWLPALTIPVVEKVGAVQVMQTFGAGTSSATNASLGPFSVVCSAFWVENCRRSSIAGKISVQRNGIDSDAGSAICAIATK